MITSPNTCHVPQFPHITGRRIVTRKDGFWGPQEYSRWPQQYHPDIVHHMCIPRTAAADGRGPGQRIWSPLQAGDFERPKDVWPHDYGLVTVAVRSELRTEVDRVVARFRLAGSGLYEDRKRHGYHLLTLLENALQRLDRIPGSFQHAVTVVAHVQRLVLELAGFCTYIEVVRPRLADPLFSIREALDVRGGFLNEPATAQAFFRVGIPFWLFQPYTESIVIREVIHLARPISSALSLEVAFPGLDASAYDPAGTWQDPSRWPAAMIVHTSLRFASANLPSLPSDPAMSAPSAPVPGSATMSSGDPDPKRTKTTPATISSPASTSVASSSKRKAHRSKRRRGNKPRMPHPAQTYIPPPVFSPPPPRQWLDALRREYNLSDTPKCAASYYFPPPYLFLEKDEKTARYLHNWLRIRLFTRQRLVDTSISGEPLRIQEWRDALYGDYHIPAVAEPTPGRMYTPAEQRAFDRKVGLRKLFAGAGGLPSYDASCLPIWQGRPITAKEAHVNLVLRCQVLWELHEVNWRCELRALDCAMLGSTLSGNALLQWEHDELLSQVWSGRGSLSIFPEYPDSPAPDLWAANGPSVPWRGMRPRIAAFVSLMSRWPGCPQRLVAEKDAVVRMEDSSEFELLVGLAINFYFSAFTTRYARLPVVPTDPPRFRG